MKSPRWHIARAQDGALVLSRQPGARAVSPAFWVETRLPSHLRPTALAHEIRKDVWRALRRVRGFSPIVEVAPGPDPRDLYVRAGGTSAAPLAPTHQRHLAALLEDPACRARWIAHTAHRGRA